VVKAPELQSFLRKTSVNEPDESGSWAHQALVIGFSGLVFGLIPTYGAGYSVYLTEAPINARLALGAIPGAALILTALLEIIVTRQQVKLILIAVLAGVLIGWHARYTNDFRNAWSAQVSFYRQLTWRVPGMAANTALVSDQNIFPPIAEFPATVALAGDFPTALAINVIYGASPQPDGRLPYWFFPVLDISRSSKLTGEHVDSRFSGDSRNSLPFTFAPQNGECLHLLRPEDASYRRLPDELKQLAASTSLAGIDVNAQKDFSILDTILGPQDTNTWCYFYEKADLARQKQHWTAIPALWDSAGQKGLRPGNGWEYLPFVEASIHLNDWDQALELTRTANKISPNMGDLYCPMWEKQAGDPAKTVRSFLECAAP
jgi:hypothetical protein